MTIEIREGRYFSRLFFQNLSDGNVMGVLFRDETNDQRWTVIYRFRYFRDDKVFDSEDERSWYTMTVDDPEKPEAEAVEVLERMCKAFEFAAAATGKGFHPVEMVSIGSDRPADFMAALEGKPWWNGRLEDGPPPTAHKTRKPRWHR